MTTQAPSAASDRLARLYAAASALTAAGTDEAALLQRIVEAAAQLVDARYAALGLLADDGTLRDFVTTGLTPEEEASLSATPPLGRGLLRALLAEGEPLRVDNVSLDPRSAGFPPNHPTMRTFLGVPLLLGDQVLGRLYMTERVGGPFTEEDEYLALGYAAAAAVAIQNARLYGEQSLLTQALQQRTDELQEDVAERRIVEAALREERDFSTAVLDTASALVVVLDRQGSIVQFNRACERATGYTFEEVQGKYVWDLLLLPEEVEPVKAVFRKLRAGRFPSQFENYWVAKDGTRRPIAWANTALLDTDGSVKYIIGTGTDITDRKQAEATQEQLLASERLQAMGELAAGITHDFNNLLATILGRTEVLINQAPEDGERESLDAIQQAARDGATTVARLRAFGRPMDIGEFHPVDLEAVCRQAVELARPRWRDEAQAQGRTIAVMVDAKPSPPVQGDPAALREALVNLIFNSVDAMPTGGHLTLHQRAADDGGVMLKVIDTGIGMPAHVRDRVFEPFFTTKGAEGSGLGLAMVQRVILSHEGRITVESSPGRGTTFSLWLPAAPATAPRDEQQVEDRTVAPLRQTCTIVLIDDQPEVLQTAALLLREDGHKALTFQDPREGVASILASRPDLVITDLGMPELSGWDVAEAIRDRWPDLPILLLTGWAHEVRRAQLREHGIASALSKPYEADDLRRAVARAVQDESAERPLRILLVDDSAGFAQALALLLGHDGHLVEQVERGSEAVDALKDTQRQGFDLVLLDLNLPDVPAQAVVAAARRLTPRPGVCVMSGSDETRMQSAAPDADLYVEKAVVPERLEAIYTLANRQETVA
ncbi:MAG: hypothetical protein CL878_09025 [Dehalococcoidia bacterium]|nr:hypothetical protein [Dehalococcoidia bacterium]